MQRVISIPKIFSSHLISSSHSRSTHRLQPHVRSALRPDFTPDPSQGNDEDDRFGGLTVGFFTRVQACWKAASDSAVSKAVSVALESVAWKVALRGDMSLCRGREPEGGAGWGGTAPGGVVWVDVRLWLEELGWI